MTSRINRNKPEYHGSTIKAIEQPDFLSTSDPWFRPVDIQIGPDGAMYILDFYNRIIGHYEVPLPHPGRDRTSGRIWRVSYKGEGTAGNAASAVGNALRGVPSAANPLDLTKLTTTQLLTQLDASQLEYRLRALNHLADNAGSEVTDAAAWAFKYPSAPGQVVGSVWLLSRLKRLSTDQLTKAANSPHTAVRIHAMKVLADTFGSDRTERLLAMRLLNDDDAVVQRAAVEALDRHPQPGQQIELVKKLLRTPPSDQLLQYEIRLAIRDHLGSFNELQGQIPVDSQGREMLSDDEMREIASVATAASSSGATQFLLSYLSKQGAISSDLDLDVERMASNISPDAVPRLVELCRKLSGDELLKQGNMVKSLQGGLEKRSVKTSETLSQWGEDVAKQLLVACSSDRIPWTAIPIDGLPASESPWVVTPRASRDGDKDSLFFSSLPRGEQRTGIYRSGVFDLPDSLSFWCAGHSGKPPAPLNDCNYIRLRDAETHELLAESRPPRNDTARMITWKIVGRSGPERPAAPSDSAHPKSASPPPRRGYIELIDADTANAYAWFAVGRFSLPALNPSDAPQKQQLAAEIIGKLKLDALKPQMVSLVAAPSTDSTARTAIAQALLAFAPDARASTLTAALADAQLPDDLRPRNGQEISKRDSATLLDCLRDVLKRSPLRLQTTLAQTLAGDAPGADALLTLIESGQAAPRLLLLPAVNNKLTALKNADLDARSASITSKLPPADAILDALITDRRRAFAQAKTNLTRGQAIFEKHCIACHKIADKGALIGPQLDGIGNRGLDRLLEDVLDPNRNVDVAFRTITLRLSDGRVLSGLQRREEGTQLILADNQGKEFSINKSEIDEQQKTPLSLMPANVAEIVPPDEFADLIAYLLNQRSQTK